MWSKDFWNFQYRLLASVFVTISIVKNWRTIFLLQYFDNFQFCNTFFQSYVSQPVTEIFLLSHWFWWRNCQINFEHYLSFVKLVSKMFLMQKMKQVSISRSSKSKEFVKIIDSFSLFTCRLGIRETLGQSPLKNVDVFLPLYHSVMSQRQASYLFSRVLLLNGVKLLWK